MSTVEKRDKRSKEKRSSAAKRVQGWGKKLSIIGGGGRHAASLSSGGGSLLGGSLLGSSSSSSSASYHAPRIDLPSTLAEFGASSPFSLSSYLQSVYAQSSPGLAAQHRSELLSRREQISEELRAYVTRHYPAFIDSTKEIITIESDMSQLTAMLASFNAHLTHLSAPSLAYSDERLFKRGREREKELLRGSERAVREQSALEEWNEALRATIYERKFERAVRLIEHAWKRWDKRDRDADRENQAGAAAAAGGGGGGAVAAPASSSASASTSALEAEMEQHVQQLVETLTAELKSATIKRPERRRIIGWLVRLGEADSALQIHLSHRSALLQAAVRSIKLTGDMAVYIHDLSSIVFAHLAVTCKDAQTLFTDDRARQSAVVVWCRAELQAYAQRLSQQVFSSHAQWSLIAACLRAAFACAAHIESQGLSFSYQVARLLAPPLVECVQRHFAQASAQVEERLREEEWRVSELWVHARDARRGPGGAGHGRKRALKLTSSARFLYDTIRALLKDLMPLLDPAHLAQLQPALYAPIVTGLIATFESYLLLMASAAKEGLNAHLDDLQSLSIIANTFYLADDLLPRVGREFRRQFGRLVPELEDFGAKLGQLYEALMDAYCHKRTRHWLDDVLQWKQLATSDYANPNPLTLTSFVAASSSKAASTASASGSALSAAALSVSPQWIALHDYFVTLRLMVGKCLSPAAVPVVLSACFEELFAALLDEARWSQLRLGYGGLLQLTRDVSFFSQAARAFETEQLHALTTRALSRARADYAVLARKDEHELHQQQDRTDGELSTRMAQPDIAQHTLSAIEERDAEERERDRKREAEDRKSNKATKPNTANSRRKDADDKIKDHR